MNNLEEKLKNIKLRDITEEEKDSLWHKVMVSRVAEENKKTLLSISVFRFTMNKLIVGALALVLILGGGGVVAASNGAGPGDFLFPVDLAIEKIQIKIAGEDRETELKFRFAEERVAEIKDVSEEKSVPVVLVTDLSAADVTEIEADVFTNETLVKIEANDRKYGYSSDIKTKAELVAEISAKYSIPEAEVNSLIDFEIENRDSRADDKGFLNKTHSVKFSAQEESDISLALNNLEELLADNEDNEKAEEIRQALTELLVLLGDDGDLEIKRTDGKIKIESENSKIEIKIESDNSGESDDGDDDSEEEGSDDDSDENSDDDSDNDSDENDDSGDSDDDDDKLIDVNLNGSISVGDDQEDDDEVFCRGEWRDPEDCDDDGSSGSNDEDEDDSESDEDNSGSGSDDEEVDD